jgi:uncharacterized phage-associated protein
MAYPPIAVANTLIQRHAASGGITHMRIQTLCYLLYGWSIPILGKPLLTEAPEVWNKGPIFGRLFSQLSHHGDAPILQPVPIKPSEVDYPAVPEEDRISHELIEWVDERHAGLSGPSLEALALGPTSPWRRIIEENAFMLSDPVEIPQAVIAHHFTAQARQVAWIQ